MKGRGNLGTYAAVAARDSKGFALVPKDNKARKTRMNAVMIPSFAASGYVYAKIQIGAINITNPMTTVVKVTNVSILLSEYNSSISWQWTGNSDVGSFCFQRADNLNRDDFSRRRRNGLRSFCISGDKSSLSI